MLYLLDGPPHMSRSFSLTVLIDRCEFDWEGLQGRFNDL